MLGSRILEKSESDHSASQPTETQELTCSALSAATATAPAICVTAPQAEFSVTAAHRAVRNTITSSSAALRTAETSMSCDEPVRNIQSFSSWDSGCAASLSVSDPNAS